jgi:hypothetical protein
MVPEMPGSESDLPREIDTSRPHPARIYDYGLGGKNHFAVDREVAEGISAQWRDGDEFARMAFTGLEMVPPGVVLVSEWRPDDAGPRPAPVEVSFYGGVARKN